MKIEDFKAWLETQPGARRFNYGNPLNCAFATFLNETAPPEFRFSVGGWSYTRYGYSADEQYITGSETRLTLPDWARSLATFLNEESLPFTVENLRANLKMN